MFEKLTERARKALSHARQAATERGADAITPEHLLLGILAAGEGVAVRGLAKLGEDFVALGAEIESALPPAAGMPPRELAYSPSSKSAIGAAEKASRDLGRSVIGAEHLLLGIVDEGVVRPRGRWPRGA